MRSEEITFLHLDPGAYIGTVAAKAAAVANDTGRSVGFEFNGTFTLARPGETEEIVGRRWWNKFNKTPDKSEF